MRILHLEEGGSDEETSKVHNNSDRIKGVMEEFMVHLSQAVKEAQQEEKHFYHCSSTEHFIWECPLVKTSRAVAHLNQREGMVKEKGAQAPQTEAIQAKMPSEGMSKA